MQRKNLSKADGSLAGGSDHRYAIKITKPAPKRSEISNRCFRVSHFRIQHGLYLHLERR